MHVSYDECDPGLGGSWAFCREEYIIYTGHREHMKGYWDMKNGGVSVFYKVTPSLLSVSGVLVVLFWLFAHYSGCLE